MAVFDAIERDGQSDRRGKDDPGFVRLPVQEGP
jgi:hypothetical protein